MLIRENMWEKYDANVIEDKRRILGWLVFDSLCPTKVSVGFFFQISRKISIGLIKEDFPKKNHDIVLIERLWEFCPSWGNLSCSCFQGSCPVCFRGFSYRSSFLEHQSAVLGHIPLLLIRRWCCDLSSGTLRYIPCDRQTPPSAYHPCNLRTQSV